MESPNNDLRTSEFARPKYQKAMSYVVGWSCCLGWISEIPADGAIAAGLIEGMVLLVNPDANFGALWQITLVIYLFMILSFAFNLYMASYLPLAEGTILVIHIVHLSQIVVHLDAWLTVLPC